MPRVRFDRTDDPSVRASEDGPVFKAGVQESSVRGRKEAAIKHALSLLPGPGVFLEAAASPRSYRV
jgi:hypothetical protein